MKRIYCKIDHIKSAWYMKRIAYLLVAVFFAQTVIGQFAISENKRYLLKNGKPFFWLGDTAWELFHRLNREEADHYLKRRSEQGFTVIQAVVLAETDGLRVPNAVGEIPLINNDPAKPNEKYFQHVDYIIDKANSYNINIGLLPTWGDKLFADRWGKGPEIFNEKTAAAYGEWIAKRYKDKTNIIWILGGDRNPRNDADVNVWRAMGNAIMKATNNKAIITFHPQPNQTGSAQWFHDDSWLAFNMFQTGHCRDGNSYDKIEAVYYKVPVKPVMDGEPIYEDHPVCFNAKDLGISNALDVRRSAYLDIFAGAHGHTYGCHDIWQMYSSKFESVNGAKIPWREAMELQGANQMIFLRKLIESHPILERVPDQSLIVENNYPPAERIQATRGNDYIFVYSTAGRPFTLNMGKIKGEKCVMYWFNPRNGAITNWELINNPGTKKFSPPSSGYGQDWVLVIDDESKKYPKP
jgi:hypothetical protein